jgi:hypothetical protein
MEALSGFYQGMTVAEATNKATAAGFQVVTRVEGIQTLTNEYRQGRITFIVRNGIVVSAVVG